MEKLFEEFESIYETAKTKAEENLVRLFEDIYREAKAKNEENLVRLFEDIYNAAQSDPNFNDDLSTEKSYEALT
jgi:aspartyl/asparaginyl beta-hydroxylase (cupin superfamily)